MDKLVEICWKLRKVADKDEALALECVEDIFGIVQWLLDNFSADLAKLHV